MKNLLFILAITLFAVGCKKEECGTIKEVDYPNKKIIVKSDDPNKPSKVYYPGDFQSTGFYVSGQQPPINYKYSVGDRYCEK